MIRHLYEFANGELSPISQSEKEESPISQSEKEDFISNYIKEWKDRNYSFKISFAQAFRFYVVYHSMEDLYSGIDYFFVEDKKKEEDRECDFPVIHLTMFDIFTPPTDSIIIPNVKRYKKIIDSSIWNYYVPFFGTKVLDDKNTLIEEISYEQFNRTLAEISQNTQNGLYNLHVSHEYADLFARLLRESHLNGSHDALSPFLFHSENEMRMKIRDFEDNHRVTLPTIRQYRWHFLLLDDKGIEPLSGANDSKINKLQIITNNLHNILGFDENKIWFRFFDFSELRGDEDKIIIDEKTQEIINEKDAQIKYGRVKNGGYEKFKAKDKVLELFTPNSEEPHTPDDIQIVIDCVKHVDAAQYCLQKYKYEIVLLDYLLAEDKKNRQEYGYNLLEQLWKWHKETYKKNKEGKEKKSEKDSVASIYAPGPNKRWFFMFISAFTIAVHERMLEKGFERTERGFWFLGDGACPTNTPYLFSYQLMLLMRHRISDLRKESEGGCLTLVDLLEKIFLISETSNSNDNLTIRESAHNHFNHVLFMGEKYHRLENDLTKEEEGKISTGRDIIEMRGSMLVQSAFQYVHLFSGAFFEHLQHLVYLIAFGTIRQWTELWEEYIFIRKTLTQYDELTKGDIGTRINEAIRNYIIRLKDNSN